MTSPPFEKRGICGICSAGCWIVAQYDQSGKITGIRPDKGAPMGMVCKIGEHAAEIIYSPNRLKQPLKRTGPKGTYDFAPISWDEAYDTIVDRLQGIKRDHGPEAAAIYTGVGSFELSFCDIFQPKGVRVSSASSVLFPFGSPNAMGVGALCYVSYGMIAPHLTTGKMLMDMYNDIENAELVVVWGTNPATDLPPIDMKRILEARSRGARVVVIDPRRTATAKLSDAQWIPIRPGTDGALALSLCHVLIHEELYDDLFVRQWTHGFDDFARYVQHFNPQAVEHITGVPAATIKQLAEALVHARGAVQLMYTGMEYSHSGVQGIRAALVLWALAGQLDVPGGRCFLMPHNHFPINRDGHIQNPGPIDTRIGADRFPVYTHYRDEAHAIALPESVLYGNPYRIRSLIILGGSMITAWPNPEIWKKTFGALDFLVCIDRQLTADAAYADIVLPAATYFETESYMVYGPLFRLRERMIPPVGEARGDVFILAELARRLGYGHLYPQNETELLEHVLKGSGFRLADIRSAGGDVSVSSSIPVYKKWEKGLLRADGQPGFETPSGKFEIHSTLLEEYDYEPLPKYIEPKESPLSRKDLTAQFPLVFNSGSRVRTGFHTQHHGIPGLNRERPEPRVTLNDQDAAQRGIRTGDPVVLSTLRGTIKMHALVTEDIAPGCIDADHAAGSPLGPPAWRDVNINTLTDLNQYDAISGFPIYKSLLCDVRKVEAEASQGAVRINDLTAAELGVMAYAPPARSVYLDCNATTPMRAEVKHTITELLDVHGNPSSIHAAGRRAREVVDRARRAIAGALGCTPRRIVFTGSGSEANNLAIKGAAFAANTKRRIITSSIEHPAVLSTCQWLTTQGFEVVLLPADAQGVIQPSALEAAIDHDTLLVSVMLANNETGVIQPIAELAEIAHHHGSRFHCDAVQGFGKVPVDVVDLNIDLLSISSHKIYGPKGVGALYIKDDTHMVPLINGGGHERGLRAGTENVIGIGGFGKAAEYVAADLKRTTELAALRDRLEQAVAVLFPDYGLNGHRHLRLPNTLNVTLPGYRGESVVLDLDKHGVHFSSGSACKSGAAAPSHALSAMGLTDTQAHCALRFSLGHFTTEKDIQYTIDALTQMVHQSRQLVRFAPCR